MASARWITAQLKGRLFLIVSFVAIAQIQFIAFAMYNYRSRSNRHVILMDRNDTDSSVVPFGLGKATDLVEQTTQAKQTTPASSNFTLCPAEPPHLGGAIKVNLTTPSSFEYIAKLHPEVLAGGRWRPTHCTARHRIAIIVPYRDREGHLKTWLQHMHPFLQKQQLDYTVFVVEQATNIMFNKAQLMNIGFTEATRGGAFKCVIFHDVDMLPEDDRTMYSCPPVFPRHLSAYTDTFGYKMEYGILTGGAFAIKIEHFKKVNGFSNLFFGWGGEDDDLFQRLKAQSLRLHRYPYPIGKYIMIKHKHDKRNPVNANRVKAYKWRPEEYKIDGLNSLNYTIRKIEKRKLFTWIYTDISYDKSLGGFKA